MKTQWQEITQNENIFINTIFNFCPILKINPPDPTQWTFNLLVLLKQQSKIEKILAKQGA